MALMLHEQVVAQARLLVLLLSTVTEDADHPLDLAGPSAVVAEQMFQGLDELHHAVLQIERPAEAPAPPDPMWYPKLVERIREAVPAVLAAGSVVAVISRGDGALVQLPGLTAWHYPQNDSGLWAGFHPAAGRDALDRLEQLRRRGAEYLLVPAPSSWWLEFYGELRESLHATAEVVVSGPDFALYRLQRYVPVPISPQELSYRANVAGFVELAGVLVPPGSTIAVVSRGDPSWLVLGGPTAQHFPASDDGTYMGHPANDAEADRALAHAVARGTRYLAIPSAFGWWEEAYPTFCRNVRASHRCIADQAEVGALFELTPHGELER